MEPVIDFPWLVFSSREMVVFFLKLLAALFLVSVFGPAAATYIDPLLLDEYQRTSGTYDTLPVIVKLRGGKTGLSTRQMSSESAVLQSSFESDVPSGVTVENRMNYLPILSLKINRQDFSSILLRNDIESIHLDRLNKPLLQQSTQLVFPTQYNTLLSGASDWTVAILDSGIESTHSFLTDSNFNNRVVAEGCFSSGNGQTLGTSICPNEAPNSFASGSGRACDVPGCDHGTHVAGIVAGKKGLNTYAGVASAVNLISLQVFTRFDSTVICDGAPPCIRAYDSDIIKALEHVFSLSKSHKIASANLSIGGGYYPDTCDYHPIKQAIDLLRSVEIPTVVAAGNNGFTNALTAPACVSSALSIGATFDTGRNVDKATDYSNESPDLDLFAPGHDIVSSSLSNTYTSKSGTSMAAPHVAGSFAVLREAAPNVTLDQIEFILKQTGQSVVSQSGLVRRRINLTDAVRELTVSNSGSAIAKAYAESSICIPVIKQDGNILTICD